MKKQFIFAAVILTVALGFTTDLFAQFNAGISIGDGGLRNFYLSVGNYYNVPEREVVVIHERRIPDEEIPVVFYIARHAHVSPEDVAIYRRRGCSWMEVSQHYGLGPDIYGRTEVIQGPPYGKAWGHYKHGRGERVYVSDNDVVNYVNTRVISERYGCSGDEVHRMRNQGYGYVNIHDRYYSNKYGRRDRDDRDGRDNRVQEYKVKGNGHGHGNGGGHGRWGR